MDDVLAIDAKMGLAVILYEAVRDMPRYLRDSGSGVSFEDLVAGIRTPNVRGFFEQAMKPGAISEAAYRDAVEVQRPALRRAYSDYFQTHDVAAVVVPTTPLPARPIEANDSVMHLGKMIYARVYLQNIGASSNAGLPTISVPAGLTKDGLPVGIEFDGPLGSEKSLFEIAAAFERAAPPLPPPPIE